MCIKDTLNGLLSGSLAQIVKRTTDGGATWDTTESKPQGISSLLCLTYREQMPHT
ncbi:MAG: hypothetical protein U5J96_19715 [Ignavibacteriaceae bacterium]|nr:hypothetical protein [Ignavibacteriaceae bacterium]